MAEVESVSRGLEVLRAISLGGGLTLSGVVQRVGLPRGTAYRMLCTLELEGLVERRGDRYVTTSRVLALSHGFDEDWVDLARPHARALGRDVLWPITLSEYAAGAALVRDTSDRESPFVFTRTKVGFRMSMLDTASGRAMLSHVSDRQRSTILDQLDPPRTNGFNPEFTFRGDIGELIHIVRGRGYDVLPTPCGKQTAIAVPILNQANEAVAALAIRYFNAALSCQQALKSLLPPLRECAATIGSVLAQEWKGAH